MKDMCKEMVKIHKGRRMVPTVVAEGLRALGEEVDTIDLEEEDQEDHKTQHRL